MMKSGRTESRIPIPWAYIKTTQQGKYRQDPPTTFNPRVESAVKINTSMGKRTLCLTEDQEHNVTQMELYLSMRDIIPVNSKKN